MEEINKSTRNKSKFFKYIIPFLVIGIIIFIIINNKIVENKRIINSNHDQEYQTNERVLSKDFNSTFEGNIGGKYQIAADLTCINGEIKGSYFYKKNRIKIEINGTLKNDSSLVINEFDKNGNQTGQFKGKMVNENQIIGKWSKPNGNNEMTFSLIKSNKNYESSLSIKKINQVNKEDIYKMINSSFIEMDNHSKSKELKSVFEEWELIMIKDSIFDYVTEVDCGNREKMLMLYDNGLYPMISHSQLITDVDYNNDNATDYIISFDLMNCVNGIGRGSYTDSFVFIKGDKGDKLKIDRNATNTFKIKMARMYKEKFNVFVNREKNGFIHLPNISFYNYKDGVISGQMFLELNNYNPQQGKFIYNFITENFSLFDSYENLGIN